MKKKPIKRAEGKYVVDPISQCWHWTGSKNKAGYGRIWCSETQRPLMAHRVLYEAERGKVPKNKELDHLCCNKSCVNPQHLQAVTSSENKLRCWATKRGLDKNGKKGILSNCKVQSCLK